jgi:hypothetical protein
MNPDIWQIAVNHFYDMRRFVLLTVLLATGALLVASGASAAKPEHGFHSESSIDPDFCGTGASVAVFFESIFTTSERDGVNKTEHQGSFTYSYNGSSVVESFAGQFTDTIVATAEDGAETHQLVSKGIPTKLSLPSGPMLSLDAGVIVELVTVQDGNVVNDEVVSTNGPHPEASSGGGLFCQVVPEALGIT